MKREEILNLARSNPEAIVSYIKELVSRKEKLEAERRDLEAEHKKLEAKKEGLKPKKFNFKKEESNMLFVYYKVYSLKGRSQLYLKCVHI
jgi:hypothetical protein